MTYRDAASRSISPAVFMASALKQGEELGFSRTDLLQALSELVPTIPEGTEPSSFFTPLSDSDMPERLQEVAEKGRKLASSLSYTGPVAWKVKAGYTLKQHAPKAGPCYQNFSYLQNWSFSDEPTKEGIVFWIPRLLPESTKKNVDEQKAVLAKLRARMELPAHHLTSFGSASLLSGLILAHYKATGERVPLDYYWTRTDTCRAGGDRLRLGYFDGRGLDCGYCFWGEDRSACLGVFALGVEHGF